MIAPQKNRNTVFTLGRDTPTYPCENDIAKHNFHVDRLLFKNIINGAGSRFSFPYLPVV